MIFIFSGEEMIYHVFTSNKNYMSCVPYFFSNFNIYSGFNELTFCVVYVLVTPFAILIVLFCS